MSFLTEDEPLAAVIFEASTKQHLQEFLSKGLFCAARGSWFYVNKIRKGWPLFLYNAQKKEMLGIFRADTDGTLELDPSVLAKKGSATKYPAQVRVIHEQPCDPLPESVFKPLIQENYNSHDPHKFDCELTQNQAERLMEAFRNSTKGPGDHAATATRPKPTKRKKQPRNQEVVPDGVQIEGATFIARDHDRTKGTLAAIIFEAPTKQQFKEFLDKKRFCAARGSWFYVNKIRAGWPLFLYNCQKHELHGIFQAASDGYLDAGTGESKKGSGSKLPAQVQVHLFELCAPLAVSVFRHLIPENFVYHDTNKFDYELTQEQADRLLQAFQGTKTGGALPLPPPLTTPAPSRPSQQNALGKHSTLNPAAPPFSAGNLTIAAARPANLATPPFAVAASAALARAHGSAPLQPTTPVPTNVRPQASAQDAQGPRARYQPHVVPTENLPGIAGHDDSAAQLAAELATSAAHVQASMAAGWPGQYPRGGTWAPGQVAPAPNGQWLQAVNNIHAGMLNALQVQEAASRYMPLRNQRQAMGVLPPQASRGGPALPGAPAGIPLGPQVPWGAFLAAERGLPAMTAAAGGKTGQYKPLAVRNIHGVTGTGAEASGTPSPRQSTNTEESSMASSKPASDVVSDASHAPCEGMHMGGIGVDIGRKPVWDQVLEGDHKHHVVNMLQQNPILLQFFWHLNAQLTDDLNNRTALLVEKDKALVALQAEVDTLMAKGAESELCTQAGHAEGLKTSIALRSALHTEVNNLKISKQNTEAALKKSLGDNHRLHGHIAQLQQQMVLQQQQAMGERCQLIAELEASAATVHQLRQQLDRLTAASSATIHALQEELHRSRMAGAFEADGQMRPLGAGDSARDGAVAQAGATGLGQERAFDGQHDAVHHVFHGAQLPSGHAYSAAVGEQVPGSSLGVTRAVAAAPGDVATPNAEPDGPGGSGLAADALATVQQGMCQLLHEVPHGIPAERVGAATPVA